MWKKRKHAIRQEEHGKRSMETAANSLVEFRNLCDNPQTNTKQAAKAMPSKGRDGNWHRLNTQAKPHMKLQ